MYVIHHSRGTLKLSAGSREQAIKWTERQLGRKAGLFSVMEEGRVDTIEKTGTGMKAMTAKGCRPVVAMDRAELADARLDDRLSLSMTQWH